MKLKTHLLLIIFIFPYTVKAQVTQGVEESIFEAEQIYRSKENLEEAVALYTKAFEGGWRHVGKTLDAITCATKVNDTTSTKNFMELGIRLGLDRLDYKRLWEYIGNNMDMEDALGRCDISSNRSIYTAQLDHNLIQELEVMANRDQEYRGEDDGDMDLQRANDSLNWAELKNLTLRLNRLPLNSEIGIDGSENLDILFYHMDKDEIEWFLPYIIRNIQAQESNLGETILYQIERLGMSDGMIYTITEDHKIKFLGKRTMMNNGMYCQSFGQWFSEKSMEDNLMYFVPIDPVISQEEVDKVRSMFHLDSIASMWKRKPWLQIATIGEFERKIGG